MPRRNAILHWGQVPGWIILLLFKAPAYLLYITAFFYSMVVLRNFDQDTTTISNASFALLATLGSICFGYKRALAASEDLLARIVVAGENFLHSAITVISASLLKYTALQIHGFQFPANIELLQNLLVLPLHVLSTISFFIAMLFATRGLWLINDALLRRRQVSVPPPA